jgi:hypothetical protein
MLERTDLSLPDRSQIERLIHAMPGETMAAWRERTCREITHHGGDALLALAAGDPAYERSRDGFRFTVSYSNASRRPIAVTMVLIGQQSVPRGDHQVATDTSWYYPREFVIPPYGRYETSDVVPGARTRREFWLNFSPSDPSFRIAARFLGPAAADQMPRLGTDLSYEELLFAGAIQRLANDAPNGFRRHRVGGANRSESSLSYNSAVDIPAPGRVGGTGIQVLNEGAAFVHKTLLDRASRADATALYRRLREGFARVWPDNPIRDSESPEGIGFQMFVTRFARVTVSMRGENNQYGVFIAMAPNLTGLTD